MKIGDVEIKKIPVGQTVECENGCSAPAVSSFNGTPFCAECLRVEEQKKWKRDGNFFVNSEGERVYFDVVETFPVDEH